MKIILIILATTISIGCGKKNGDLTSSYTDPNPNPTPRVIMDTITAVSTDLTKGTVDPATQIVVKGSSYHINFIPKIGYRADTLWEDGNFKMEMNDIEYYNDTASASHKFDISFTNKLTSSHYNAIINLITNGKWYDFADSVEPRLIYPTPGWWNAFQIDPCTYNNYDFYHRDGTGGTIRTGNTCQNADTSAVYGNWSLSQDGKIMNISSSFGSWNYSLESISDSFMVTLYDDGVNYLYKYVDAHHPR